MNRNLALVTSMLAIALGASQAGGKVESTGWALVTTKQGCNAYWAYYPRTENRAEILRKNSFSWEGSVCEAGKLINGRGVLTNTFQIDSESHGVVPYRGQMVNGAFDGKVERLTRGYGGAPASVPYRVYDTEQYRMGCRVVDTWCTPRKPLPASATGRSITRPR